MNKPVQTGAADVTGATAITDGKQRSSVGVLKYLQMHRAVHGNAADNPEGQRY